MPHDLPNHFTDGFPHWIKKTTGTDHFPGGEELFIIPAFLVSKQIDIALFRQVIIMPFEQ